MTMSAVATAIGTWVLLWRSIDREAEGTKMQILAVTSLVWVAISTLMLLAVVLLLVHDSCLAFESLAMVRRRPRDRAANDEEEAIALDIYGEERRRRMSAGCPNCGRPKLWSASEAVVMVIVAVSAVAIALHTSVFLWRLIGCEALGTKIRVAAAIALAWLSVCLLMAIAAAVLHIRDARMAFKASEVVARCPRDGAGEDDEKALAIDVSGEEEETILLLLSETCTHRYEGFRD
ncbi:hypothetical protein C4D60_Mb07t26370 [Musa balbisiana]|uniref:Uncharacterized protein n=1 Tax=Musa balbisiana TaxID=52838 RepID=A0A4S8JI56_MUSBA|nr:hypothetical protein C4D60_Mb07t26370 [Musa balbisiana]